MTSVDIDFQRIRPHQGSRSHGFEELVAQLASLERRSASATFSRKGVGADAGVECFLKAPGGEETCWQAKYFFSLEHTQIQQLDDSIAQAIAKHAHMTRYIVGLPFNLRDARVGNKKTELKRWTEWVAKWTSGRDLQIELWNASELTKRLTLDEPAYAGRRMFWFDETVLSTVWFQQRFDQARAGLGDRYTPELNIELPIRRSILAFCRDPSLIASFEKWCEKVNEYGYRASGSLSHPSVTGISDDQKQALETSLRDLDVVLASVSAEPDKVLPLTDILGKAKLAYAAASACSQVLWGIDRKVRATSDHLGYSISMFERLSEALTEIKEELNEADWCRAANSRQLLVAGEAGTGKSHLLGDAVDYQVSRERPALLILGGTLTEREPWSQVMEQFGLQGMKTDVFLGALDAAAQAAGTRAVLFVDAINERHGLQIWPTRLASFLKTIEPYPRLAVALSCRSTYLPFIIPADTSFPDLCRITHLGFADSPEAARFYLDRRGIVRMAAPNLIPEFENPLFLRTCCDFLAREGRKEIPRGLRGVSAIFDFYSQAVAQTIERKLELDPRGRIVSRALSEFAAACDEGDRGYVSLEQARTIFENALASGGSRERNLLTQLESEGVIAVEPVAAENGAIDETVRFTFERYSDHRIASRLLDQHLDVRSVEDSFAVGTPLYGYVTGDRAYERAGVIDALAIQLPERCDRELPDVLPKKMPFHWLIGEAFRSSLLWRDQKKFTRRTLDLLKASQVFPGGRELERTLVAIATEPDNQFNARFLHDRLMALSMPDRDRDWSIFVAGEADDGESPIETLIAWTIRNGMEPMDEDRVELAATALCWLFSTSSRSVRDRATKALAILLAPRLKLAATLIGKFASVNDLYVLDRTLAAIYGAALQVLDRSNLAELAGAVFEAIFANGRPVAHVLIRDHARGIIELAAMRGVLPECIDIAAARPPYASDWPLEDAPETLIDTYQEDYGKNRLRDDIVGSTVNDGDFARYIIDHTVDDWSDLPMSAVGHSQQYIFEQWQRGFLARHPRSAARLAELELAGAALRAEGAKRPSRFDFEIVLVSKKAPDRKKRKTQDQDNELAGLEAAFDAAEKRVMRLLDKSELADYEHRARAYVHRNLDWRAFRHSWPVRMDRMQMRRWVCRRAHDLGWTPERFSAFDRHIHNVDRMQHRMERIGKKYQWIALHELAARLGDNRAFAGRYGQRDLKVFDGPWQVGRRDMDPSLLATSTHEDGWRHWDQTWWMPVSVKLRAMPIEARLLWLDGDTDIIAGPELIGVTDPKTKREWLVLREFAAWREWVMRQGDRQLQRDTSFYLHSVAVRTSDLDALLERWSNRDLSSHDIPGVDMDWAGYLGEYPWHPVYGDAEAWAPEDDFGRRTTPLMPLVTNYLAERSGYDYSIDETFNFSLPAPGLIQGLNLRLSDGKKLSYEDSSGRVQFYDPTTVEPGPQAALVDREQFLAFLKRNELTAVWVITGEKSVHGGKPHGHGYGGSRSFTALHWLDGDHFESRFFVEPHHPTEAQLAEIREAEQEL
ncbi:MAG: NACHT domain-containing protein [Burkholderiales bacterium]